MEHTRAGNNPNSHQNNAIAKHYQDSHIGEKKCKITFTILDRQPDSVRRKISEAIRIQKDKPRFNNKDELKDVTKFVV